MIIIKKYYFVINGIKYIILYNNGNREIYKEENNQLIPLNSQEQKIINDILTYDSKPICKSERLNKIFLNNNSLGNNTDIYQLLNWLEQIIPENCRENFYRNLSTLQLNQNLNAIGNPDTPEFTGGTTGFYDPETNSITMSDEYLNYLWQEAQQTSNPQEHFNQEYYRVLLHEMSHMASTSYNPETKEINTGFDTFGASERNTGLNEGMTEAIAMAGIPGTDEMRSRYYLEGALINQLIQVIGNEEMLSSYFSAQGVSGIKDRLTQFGLTETDADYLLNQIEFNYLVHSKYPDYQSNALSEIQTTLLNCFEERCRQELASPNFDREKLESMFSIYENMLITPYVLEQNQMDSTKYEGLDVNIERIRSLREQYVMPNTNESSISNSTAQELREIKEQLEQVSQQQPISSEQYEQYRQQMIQAYLEEKEPDTIVHSSFNIISGENPTCDHRLERVNENGREVLQSHTFDYNDDFRQNMLSQSVNDYAQCSPVLDTGITQQENGNVNMQVMGENNNVLTVNNVEPEMAVSLNATVQQTPPTVYEQQQTQQMAIGQEMGGQQLSKTLGTMNGFSNTLILGFITSLICIGMFILFILFNYS